MTRDGRIGLGIALALISGPALAHAIGDKVEAAYRRGDLFEKRRRLMLAWGNFVDQQAAKGDGAVVSISPRMRETG